MKRSDRKKFDPALIASLIPGEAAKQVDVMGRPLKVGDRVDDTTDYLGGVVVAVYGDTAIFVVDYDSGFGMGRFASQNCNELRLLPTPGDVRKYVAKLLAYKKVIDQPEDPREDKNRRANEAAGILPPRSASLLTRLEPEKCVDQNGRQVEIGDMVWDFGNEIGGIVVGLAGRAVMFKMPNGVYDGTLVGQCISASAPAAKGGK